MRRFWNWLACWANRREYAARRRADRAWGGPAWSWRFLRADECWLSYNDDDIPF